MADDTQRPIIVRRKKKVAGGSHGGAWKIAYADFVTAMMAFFLLMWLLGSTSKADLEGISEYFKTPLKVYRCPAAPAVGDATSVIKGGGTDLSRTDGQVRKGETPAARKKGHRPCSRSRSSRAGGGASSCASSRRSSKPAIESNPSLKQFRNQLLLDITSEGLRIQIVDEQNRPMFASGRAELQPYTRVILREIATSLNGVDNRLGLSGHTDATPYPGGEKGYSNWELSADRANASRREMIAGRARRGQGAAGRRACLRRAVRQVRPRRRGEPAHQHTRAQQEDRRSDYPRGRPDRSRQQEWPRCPAARSPAGSEALRLGAPGCARASRASLPPLSLAQLACVWLMAMPVYSAPAAALAQGAMAALLGRFLGLPAWWVPLNFAFPVLAFGAGALDIDPLWYLAAFGAAFLVFGTATIRSGVPLYLSGNAELEALSALLPAAVPLRLLDAGSGIGTMVAYVSARRPDACVTGIESALGPWLLSRLRASLCAGRFQVSLGDFWNADFSRYDVVYAYLSPAAMPRLWSKARREMRPGTLLVSNSFEIAGQPATRTIQSGGPAARLYVWHM